MDNTIHEVDNEINEAILIVVSPLIFWCGCNQNSLKTTVFSKKNDYNFNDVETI